MAEGLPGVSGGRVPSVLALQKIADLGSTLPLRTLIRQYC